MIIRVQLYGGGSLVEHLHLSSSSFTPHRVPETGPMPVSRQDQVVSEEARSHVVLINDLRNFRIAEEVRYTEEDFLSY